MSKTILHAQNARDYKKVPNTKIDGIIGQQKGDFGGDFANYTPPKLLDLKTDYRIVEDTDAANGGTNAGIRLYVHANGQWQATEMTKI